MRGRPSPFWSLALAAFLLVPAAIGGADNGPASPAALDPPNERHVASSHHSPSLSVDATNPYVDLVVTFQPGDNGAAKGDPRWVLGTPGLESLGLGRNGCITLAFTDLVIRNDPQDPRANLRIFEHMDSYGEHATLDLSSDGIRYVRYGLVNGGTTDLDLAHLAIDNIRFIRLTDTGTNVYTTSTNSGYDLRGVQALTYDSTEDLTLGLIDDTGLRTSQCTGIL